MKTKHVKLESVISLALQHNSRELCFTSGGVNPIEKNDNILGFGVDFILMKYGYF